MIIGSWRKLFAVLRKALFYTLEQQDIRVEKGFMMKHDKVYQEKGVDVKIATDIIRGAFLDEYDECYIISSDTDIIPAIRCALDFKEKEIIYVGFEHFVSKALSVNCSKTFIIKRQDIIGCEQIYRSYLMGGNGITNKDLKIIGVEIVETASDGDRKIKILPSKLSLYEDLVINKLSNGFWNDIVGSDKIIFIFKFKNGAVKKFILSMENQKEIAQLCHEFNNDPLEKTSDVLKYLSGNGFYSETIKSYLMV